MDIQVRQGIHYAEQRNLFSRISSNEADQRISGILIAFDGATEGFQTKLAVSLDRANPWLIWDAVQNAAAGPFGHNLTGIDFASSKKDSLQLRSGHSSMQSVTLTNATLSERLPP
jgi:hypothetical protein